MGNAFDSMIFRCVIAGERTHLDLKDQALIIDDDIECIPAGYGLYLFSNPKQLGQYHDSNMYQMPDNCCSGSFIMRDECDTLTVMATNDIPDRTLFTTGLCNSNCIMCPYTERFRLHSKLEPIDKLNRFIELMDPYAEYICITGGEPTMLRNDFLRLIAHAKDHFVSGVLHILTNGRTFAYRDFLEEFIKVRPYKTLLGIPIHADNPVLHDYISQTNGSFDETTQGLDNLYAAGEHLELRIVTSKLNCTNLPNLARMIVARYPYCQHVCMMGLEMMGNAMINRSEVWCNYNELWSYVREAVDILIMNGVEVELYNYPLCLIDHKLQPLYRKSITPSKIEYLEDCESCRRKAECGGFFRTTKIMSGITVKPY